MYVLSKSSYGRKDLNAISFTRTNEVAMIESCVNSLRPRNPVPLYKPQQSVGHEENSNSEI